MPQPIPPLQPWCKSHLPWCKSHLLAAALALALASCQGKPAADPRGELAASLGGADVKGYLFALSEGATQKTSSLTNSAGLHPTALPKTYAAVVPRYTTTHNPTTAAAKTSTT